jgi:AraC-like DNA-binding protein
LAQKQQQRISRRGPYKVPERLHIIKDIRSLLIAGYSYSDIIQQLQMEPRTFYRYLSAVFEDDRRLLIETITNEEFLNQMAICRDRLLDDRRTLQEWMKDPGFSDKVAAMSLSAEIAAGIFRMYCEGPGYLAARHQFPRTSLTAKGTTGARLVLRKQEQEKEEDWEEEEAQE